MNSRVLAAIAAAVLALVGIGAVVYYANSANSRAFGGAQLKSVYRATGDIHANATAEEVQEKVVAVRVPNSAVGKGAITNLADIQGLKTTVPLVEGEILVKSRFDEGGSSAASGSAVPKGMQEITVPFTAANAGKVSAGQRVGIIVVGDGGDGTAARMFAQGVLITGVEASGEGMLVTFAANGQLSTQIAMAAAGGQMRLTIQNDDATKDGGKSVEIQSLVK
jgi:pilus assembly protein CpaB